MLVSSTRRVGGFLGLLVVLFVLSSAATASAAPNPISPFLDDTLSSVDTYWHQTDAAEGRPAPSVQHAWVAPGARVNTGCGDAADDKAAFYCPTDDTIYVGQAFASQLYDGVVNGLPGERAGYGRAAGAFAVGYVIAHEYGHNVQQELGELSGRAFAMPTELNADCLAGTWLAWDYGQGKATTADEQQVLDAAMAVGDFEYTNPDHHGTPEQRRDAVKTGMDSGKPSACDKYLMG